MTIRQQLEKELGRNLTDEQYNKVTNVAKNKILKYGQLTPKDRLIEIIKVYSEAITNC